ncbi:hypothetical protein BGZ58_001736, partial [Dissophora ornata]
RMSTIHLPTPVVADQAAHLNIVNLLMNTIAAADKDLQALRKRNECLTNELAEINTAAFESDQDGHLRVEEEDSGDDDDITSLDGWSRDSEKAKRRRKGKKKKESGSRKPRTYHVRVMTTGGKAFEAKLEDKMLRMFSEIVIVPDECKIILK